MSRWRREGWSGRSPGVPSAGVLQSAESGVHPQVKGTGCGLNCELVRLPFKQSSHPARLVLLRLSRARKQYPSENVASGRLSLSDELLQEQRADMDQFSSSFSETPVDVGVSSEESDEIPPFHPLHPFPSLPENEGACAEQASPAVGPRAGRDTVRKWKSDGGRGGSVGGLCSLYGLGRPGDGVHQASSNGGAFRTSEACPGPPAASSV